MTIEFTMLALSVVLGIVTVLATGMAVAHQHGLAYNMSARDEQLPLTGVGARLQRALANFMQTFPFFAAAVLMAHASGRHGWLTVLGAQLFFWARLVYLPAYAFAIPVIRSVAFLTGVVGIVMLLIALI